MVRMAIPSAQQRCPFRLHAAVSNTAVMQSSGWFLRCRKRIAVRLELDIMQRPIVALVLTAGLAMATVAVPTQAQARWGGWGWGLGGFALGALAGAAIASSSYGYPDMLPHWL
jgi:hypothetical protein